MWKIKKNWCFFTLLLYCNKQKGKANKALRRPKGSYTEQHQVEKHEISLSWNLRFLSVTISSYRGKKEKPKFLPDTASLFPPGDKSCIWCMLLLYFKQASYFIHAFWTGSASSHQLKSLGKLCFCSIPFKAFTCYLWFATHEFGTSNVLLVMKADFSVSWVVHTIIWKDFFFFFKPICK